MRSETDAGEVVCSGCRAVLSADEAASYDGYYNTAAECWAAFTGVVGVEFGNAVLFGQVHQLTVDAYAVQHAGARHPDKSIAVHLSGLHLVLDRGLPPPRVPRLLQTLAARVRRWPHYPPPADRGPLTVLHVAGAPSPETHVERAREWAAAVWQSWSPHHPAVAAFVAEHLDRDPGCGQTRA